MLDAEEMRRHAAAGENILEGDTEEEVAALEPEGFGEGEVEDESEGEREREDDDLVSIRDSDEEEAVPEMC